MVCAGSGGVGKTTCAAALGVRAAQLGRRVLVLTVDPARRLATALGLDLSDPNDREVKLQGVSGKMSAAVIDSKHVFDTFIRRHSNQAELVARIMKNRLYQQLSTTLSGSQEFTAVERLLEAVESNQYDLIILDTPPTKHAVDFFTAPQRINALFQDSITRWFMAPGSGLGGGIFSGLISRGTKLALKSLETLTGGPFIEELVDFFAAIRSVQKVLQERSSRAYDLLRNPDTRFIVVTSFDQAKLLEACYLKDELKRLGFRFEAVVINRAFPIGLSAEAETHPSPSSDSNSVALDKVRKFYKSFKEYYAFRYSLYEDFVKNVGSEVVMVRVPEYQKDIYGTEDLVSLATLLGSPSADKAEGMK